MSETREQIDFTAWFIDKWPEHRYSIRPSMNGLSRRGKAGAILWNTMKALGASVGDPDILITIPKGGYNGIFIEHKAEDQPHKLSIEQLQQLQYHRGLGYEAISTRGLDVLKAAVTVYMED
jgi:hypothetical protein